MNYNEEDYLNVSGIQHFSFCRRQWALIHIEQQWNENLLTVEGNILHEHAHDGYSSEKRGDVLISRGMPVYSRIMGVNGVCDIVEFHKNPEGVNIFGREDTYIPMPVEYKRGKEKENPADLLQLSTQAMCLEEMLLCNIREAQIYYGETKHRIKVNIDTALRKEALDMIHEMHSYYDRRYTPKVKPTKACNSCSLKDLCLPKLCKVQSASSYIKKHILEEDE